MAKVIVFTDLDGTLLDGVEYGFEGAEDALSLLSEKGIPLILASSKTRSEVEACREKLGNTHPFISENGGGVFVPKGYFPKADGSAKSCNGYDMMTFGVPYEELRRALIEVRDELSLDIRGFGDMTAEEVSKLTGLTLSAARLAKAREFDEPFICVSAEGETDDATLGRIFNAIKAKGLAWTRGRLCHILGAGTDKALALKYLKAKYEGVFAEVTVIVLGDSLNDMAMLREADIGILMAKPDGSYEEAGKGADKEGLIKVTSGPRAWSDAVLSVLEGVL